MDPADLVRITSLSVKLRFTVVVEGFLRELQNCGRISISHVSVAFRGLLLNTFFRIIENVRGDELKCNGKVFGFDRLEKVNP